MISSRGIEANPEKINAILQMGLPKSTQEVQRLIGRVAALNRFISKSAEKFLPFFRLLRRATRYQWTKDYQRSFDQLKEYLSTPPLLASPKLGEPLFVYLAALDETVVAVLVREERGHQYPVYYVSRALQAGELHYSKLEKIAFALIITARMLRQYFQAHPITILTDQPLKDVLAKVDSAG